MEHRYEGQGILGHLNGNSFHWWRPERLTWEVLLGMEPRLALAEAVVACSARPLRESEWRGIRGTLDGIVGWYSPHRCHPLLGTSVAYDRAFDHLRDLSEGLGRRRRR